MSGSDSWLCIVLPADEVFGGLVWAAGCEKWDFDPAFFLQVQ